MDIKNPKDIGLASLVGAAVVVVTPLIEKAVVGISFTTTPLVGAVTIGTLIGAAVSATAMTFVADKYLR